MSRRIFAAGPTSGDFQIQPAPARQGSGSSDGFGAYLWSGRDGRSYVIVVNYTEHRGQCCLVLPFPERRRKRLLLTDMKGDEARRRELDRA